VGNFTVYTTSDLNTWTQQTTPADSASFPQALCISEGAGLFVVGGRGFGAVTGPPIMYSSDGVTWNFPSGSGFTSTDLVEAIAWNGSLFVAVGNFGPSGYTAATSPDGITWTIQPVGTSGSTWSWLAWCAGPDIFMAWATDPGNAFTSPDGVTWTAVPGAPTYMNGGFTWDGSGLGVWGNSYRGGGAAGTTDTTTFAVIGGLALNLYTEAVGWIGGQWVLTGPNFDGPTLPSVQISPDTLTWTAVATPMDGNQFPRNAVVDGDGLAVILATGANFGDITCMSSSDDGASWSSHYSPFDYPGSGGSNSCRDALWTGTEWIVVGFVRSPAPPPVIPWHVGQVGFGANTGTDWLVGVNP